MTPLPSLRGSLDVVTPSAAMGWAFSPDMHGKLIVQALLNRTIIGEATANIHRSDLAAVGMGDGNCGYNITYYHEISPIYLPFVTVKLEDSDVELPRAEIFGFAEYFTALYRTHPVSGRQRSVFGGFWTDRIDAAALLRDRVEIGMISTDISSILSGFVQSGFAIIEVAGPPGDAAVSSTRARRSAGSFPRDPIAVVSTVLQSQPLPRFLHAILEGHPLALSTMIVEGVGEGFRQASIMEALPSPNECLALVVPLDDRPVELDVIRDSHQFPEFSGDGQSRWVNPSGQVSISVALEQRGMIDQYTIPPGSVAVVSPGLIHRVRTEPGASALRVHCTPSRIAPLDRMLDGSRKELVLESGARIWI